MYKIKNEFLYKMTAPVKGVDRFAQSRRIKQYQERYLNHDQMYEALDCITDAATAAGMSVLEAAVRWTQHHSAVEEARGVCPQATCRCV